MQDDPSAQATHAPAAQTAPAPHDVPFGASPLTVQTGPPELHESAPVLQGSLGVQVFPSVHATQFPVPVQTWFVPQLAPAAIGVAVSTHTGPALHDCEPTSHGFVGVHFAPTVQSTHEPLEHTLSAPHDLPSDANTPALSVHTGTPVLHV